jgi:hypothetical protein
VRPACLNPQTAAIAFTDTDDAKSIISAATGIKDTKVLESLWPRMTAADLLATDSFTDGLGNQRHEIVDVLNDFLSLV